MNATCHSPKVAATTANPAAGTVVTEMNTPINAAAASRARPGVRAGKMG